jgi:hypothetical protein
MLFVSGDEYVTCERHSIVQSNTVACNLLFDMINISIIAADMKVHHHYHY